MDKRNLAGDADRFLLGEIISAEVWRGHRGYYNAEPDEVLCVGDLIVNNGASYIAQRIFAGDSVASAMNYMAVGTVTTAATFTDTQPTGEVARKALAVGSATSNNLATAIATFGGAADSLTSVDLGEAGLLNHASSGQGTLMQRITFSTVTLTASDLLKITMQTNIGSRTI